MTAPQKPLLTVENLHISYKVGKEFIPAVRDFKLQLQRGQIYGIVGESGSGKSTVAKALLQFLDKGGRIEKKSRIELLGDDLMKKSRRDMQHLWGQQLKLVPQNASAALNPSVKVGQQVAEVLQAATGTNEKTALKAAIDVFHQVKLVDPEKVADRYPHELSGGMQQRITIAMALISDPDLLVMDEPTTGLDVTTEAVILDLIRDLITENDAGVIYITHNLGVVAQICERISVLYAGEIMEDASTDDLFAQPYHPYTIGLLSSIPRVGQTREQSILQSIPGNPPSLQDLPHGCVFADRCPVVVDKCVSEKPPLEKPAAGRMVRCHRWQEIKDFYVYEMTHEP
ncbi:MAG: ABC transporter ATP-binding protein [Aggregatilineales bacterium]